MARPTPSPALIGPRVVAILLVGILLLPLLGAGAATAEPTAAIQADCSVTAEEALNAQDQAQTRLEQLRQLAAEGAEIDQSVIRSVESHIEQGQLDFRTEEYCAATDVFETAHTQASAELVRAYRSQTELLLNASAGQLGALERRGFHTYEVNQLQERVQRERDRLHSADSVAAARSSYERAKSIRGGVRALPTPTQVWIAERLVSPWAVAVIAVLLAIGAIIGAAIDRSIARGPSGPGGEIEIGGSFDD